MPIRDASEVVRLLQDEVPEQNDATSEENEVNEPEQQEASDTESSCIENSLSEIEFLSDFDEFSDSLAQDWERARSKQRQRGVSSKSRGSTRLGGCRKGEKSKKNRRNLNFSRPKYEPTNTSPTEASFGHSELNFYLPHTIGEAKKAKTPLEAWVLLFSDSLLKKVVLHTNEEIDVKLENIVKQWHHNHTNLEEIKALLGLFYISGVFKASKCNPEDLWSVKSGLIQFRGTMSINRFRFLISCLHFDDKRTREQRKRADKFAPIREIWDEFVENCKRYYSPSQWCTIDEQLLGFRGCCPFRIYMKNKPEKYGIKLVMLNDARTGYMLNAIPYTGIVENEGLESIPDYYVRKLSEPIHGSRRNVTTDNWFTSVPIVEKMLTQYSITMLGTIRKNKKEIPESFKTARNPGTADFLYDHNKMLLSYVPRSNKIVLLLSSLNQDPAIDDSTGKPVAILDYNRTKGGTDMFDQFCHRYTTVRKTYRWPLRVFFGMLDQVAVNSCALYNFNYTNKILTHRSFLNELSASLIEPHLRLRATNWNLQKSLRNCIAEILSIDFPSPQERNDLLITRMRCHYCARASDHKTRHACIVCRVPICPKHRRTVCYTCSKG